MTKHKTAIIFLLLLNFSTAFSQPIKDFKTMKHVYEDWLGRRYGGADCDTIYYKESIKPEVIDSTIKRLAEKRSFPISELYMGDSEKPFIITQAEQTYLINELKKLKEFKWPAKMFPQSQKVKPSDLHRIFVKTGSYVKHKSNMCSIVYGFSKPIYIRNKTICLYLEEEQYRETYSQLTFGFYKINNKEWQEYADVFIDFGGEMQEEITEETKTNVPETKSLPSGQLDIFAKKIFSAIQKNHIDTLTGLIPTFDERLSIIKSMGISAPGAEKLPILREAYKDNTSNLENRFKDIFKTLSEKNIDLSKATYDHIEKQEEELTLSLKNDAKPYLNTSLDIFFMYDNRKFVIKIPEVHNVRNSLKIFGLSLIEVK